MSGGQPPAPLARSDAPPGAPPPGPLAPLPLRRLGRSPVHVTELSFGGAAIGNLFTEVSEQDARAAVDAAWDGGIRTFDTAPHYGLGLSERRLGDALRHRPRDEYVICTKVGRLLDPGPPAPPAGGTAGSGAAGSGAAGEGLLGNGQAGSGPAHVSW